MERNFHSGPGMDVAMRSIPCFMSRDGHDLTRSSASRASDLDGAGGSPLLDNLELTSHDGGDPLSLPNLDSPIDK